MLAVRSAIGDCLPAPTGLIGWWAGDGDATDIAGGNSGSLSGGATANAAGKNGLAFGFDGTNGYVQIPDSSSLRPTNLTVEAWVWFDSLDSAESGGSPAGAQCIVWKQQTLDFPAYNLEKTRTAAGDVFSFAVSDLIGDLAQVQATTAISTGVWYHIAGVRGTDFLQIFVNGQLQGQTNVGFPQVFSSSPAPLYFGSTGIPGWDQKLFGRLDEVSLYNRTLAPAEVATIYAAGAAGKCKQVSIRSQPQDQTVRLGSNAAFQVIATGFGTLKYQWQFNRTNLAGASSPTLVLTNVQPTDAGDYNVLVTNLLNSTTSSVAVLTVQVPPAILSSPLVLSFVAGTNAVLTASASGTPPLSYQWQVNGSNTPSATSSNLVLHSVGPSSSGVYAVVVSNVAGSITGIVATINVVCPSIRIGPAVLANATAGVVYDAFLTASGGTGPYTFAATGGLLPSGLGLSPKGELAGLPLYPGTNIFSVTARDANGCRGTNSYSLVVWPVAPPSILSEPASQTLELRPYPPCTGGACETATFNATVSGAPVPTLEWRVNGTKIVNSAHTLGASSAALTIIGVQPSDAGDYTLIASNMAGMTTSTVATLTLTIPQIRDLRLEDAIRSAISKPVGPLSCSDLQKLVSLVAFDSHITDLAGLECASNLSSLFLGGNLIADLGPLTNLTALTCLVLYNNHDRLVDISPLRGLTRLSYLDLRCNPNITDFSYLSGLTSLTNLFLGSTGFTNLGLLSNLSQLAFLDINNNGVADFSTLGMLPALTGLDVGYNPNADHHQLAGLTNLSTLYSSGNYLTNVNDLSNLKGLGLLMLVNNAITDLSALGRRTNLNSLSLAGNPVTNYSILSRLAGLQSLWLHGNSLSNASFLASLVSLKSLVLADNQISVSTALPFSLVSLDLRGNQMTSCAGLAGLTNLSYLSLGNNSITDAFNLGTLTQLRALDLSSNSVADVSALARLTNLCSLNLSANPISNYSAVSHLQSLTHLYLRSDGVGDLSFIGGLGQLNVLDLQGNPVADVYPLASLSKLTSLNLSSVPLGNWQSLALLSNLSELSIENDSIRDLGFIQSLPRLTKLDLLQNVITDLTPLAGLTNLQVLSAGYNRLTNLDGLGCAARLSTLDLRTNLLALANGSESVAAIQCFTSRWIKVVYDPQNQPPTISFNSLPKKNGQPYWPIGADTSSQFHFTVSDDDTPPRQLNVAVTSADPPLLPSNGLALDGTNDDRTLTLTPAPGHVGTSLVNLVVTDLAGLTRTGSVLIVVVEPERVNISDPSLAEVLAVALNSSGSDINNVSMLALTQLSAEGANITNLVGLEWATNLNSLLVAGNRIDSIAPITRLTELTSLNLSRNRISDIRGLSNLEHLRYLDLSGNPITNYSGLSELTNLTSLYLTGNGLTNVEFLLGANGLISLGLDTNKLTDISPLGTLANLETLFIQQNRISDLGPFANLAVLTYLDVRLNLVDLSGNPALDALLEKNRLRFLFSPQREPPNIDVRTNWVIAAGAPSSVLFNVFDTGPFDESLSLGISSNGPNVTCSAGPVDSPNPGGAWLLTATPGAPLPGSNILSWITLSATNDVGLTSAATIQVAATPVLPVNSNLLGGGSLVWSNGGDVPWFGEQLIANGGGPVAQSGAIANEQQSLLQTSVLGPGRLSFWWKVSSQTNADLLEFDGGGQSFSISGEVDWEERVVYIDFGRSVLTWRYSKDEFNSSGWDAGWFGSVTFEPGPWLETGGLQPDGQVQFVLHCAPGRLYEVQTAPAVPGPFSSTNWLRWNWLLSTKSRVPFAVNATTGLGSGFYRVRDRSLWLDPPRLLGNGTVELVARNLASPKVEFQFSTDLMNWASLAVVTNAGLALTNFDILGTNASVRFYRAVALP